MQRALSTVVFSFPQSFLAFPQRPFAPPYISLNLHLAKCGISLLSPPSRSIAFFFFYLDRSPRLFSFLRKSSYGANRFTVQIPWSCFSVCLYSFRRAVAFVRPFWARFLHCFKVTVVLMLQAHHRICLNWKNRPLCLVCKKQFAPSLYHFDTYIVQAAHIIGYIFLQLDLFG